MSQGAIQGTVPYLGMFLTDLMMLDTAIEDYLYVRNQSLAGDLGLGEESMGGPGALTLVRISWPPCNTHPVW
jgi:hypothetical protein